MTLSLRGATGIGAGAYSRSGVYWLEVRRAVYGTAIGTSSGSEAKDGNGSYGLTEDTSKSGVITDTSNFVSVNTCIKY